MIESDLIRILQRSVTEAVGTSIPVKYIGVNFKKPSNDKYWEIVYIPNNVNDEFWGTGKTYRGIMRLILHWPQNNKGVYTPMEEAERVAEFYEKGKQLFNTDGSIKLIITDNVDLGGIYEDESSLLLPLTIPYLCFKL